MYDKWYWPGNIFISEKNLDPQFGMDDESSSSSASDNDNGQGSRGRWTDDEEDSDNIYDDGEQDSEDSEDSENEDDIFDEDNDPVANQVSIELHMHVLNCTCAVIRNYMYLT